MIFWRRRSREIGAEGPPFLAEFREMAASAVLFEVKEMV